MNHSGIANRWNADLIDQNYAIWQSNPQALDAHWQAFFEGFTLAHGSHNGHFSSDKVELDGPHLTDASKQARAIGLIYAYRSIGHTIAKINPLAKEAPQNPRLTLERLGFSESDLDHVVHTGNYLNGTEITIRELIDRLERTYCHFHLLGFSPQILIRYFSINSLLTSVALTFSNSEPFFIASIVVGQ